MSEPCSREQRPGFLRRRPRQDVAGKRGPAHRLRGQGPPNRSLVQRHHGQSPRNRRLRRFSPIHLRFRSPCFAGVGELKVLVRREFLTSLRSPGCENSMGLAVRQNAMQKRRNNLFKIFAPTRLLPSHAFGRKRPKTPGLSFSFAVGTGNALWTVLWL